MWNTHTSRKLWFLQAVKITIIRTSRRSVKILYFYTVISSQIPAPGWTHCNCRLHFSKTFWKIIQFVFHTLHHPTTVVINHLIAPWNRDHHGRSPSDPTDRKKPNRRRRGMKKPTFPQTRRLARGYEAPTVACALPNPTRTTTRIPTLMRKARTSRHHDRRRRTTRRRRCGPRRGQSNAPSPKKDTTRTTV